MNQLRFDGIRQTDGWVRPFLLPLLLLMTLLLLTACGGGTDTAEETAVEPEPVEINEPIQEDEPPAPTATPIPEPTLTADERLERGQEYAEAENFDEAIVELQAVLEQEPDNADALAILGGIYLTQEKFDEAIVELNKAIDIESGHPLALSNLCSGLGIQGAENALDICKQAVFLNPDDADTYNGLGIAHGQQGQFDEAIAAFQDAIQIDPDHNWAHNNLGRTYINMERFADSIAELNEAIRITPDNAKAHYNLGLAYANLEQYKTAVPAYQEALRHDPSMVLTHIDLAVVYTRMEQFEEAAASFENYLEVAPNADNREAVEAEIARLNAIVMAKEAMANAGTVDFANPASVLQAVFYAAANSDYTILASLCDPLGENDGDTALICEVTADHDTAGDFAAYFGDGRISGDLIINGDQAELPFLFGPDGDQSETMNFIQRDGKWYLYGF